MILAWSINDNFYTGKQFKHRTYIWCSPLAAHSIEEDENNTQSTGYDIAFVDLGFPLKNLANVVPGPSASEKVV
jgi:hypothetical protein